MSTRRIGLGLAFCVLSFGLVLPGASAQIETRDGFSESAPSGPRTETPSPPQMSFQLLAEIPLPGPLPVGELEFDGSRVRLPVSGGVAETPPEADSIPILLPAPLDDATSAGSSDGWLHDASGEHRFRSVDGRFLRAEERKERTGRGWSRLWKLRVPGVPVVAPLVRAERVYFGALDNRIYCVKRKNGHRLWTADIGGRISGKLVHWTEPESADAPPIELILVVPDEGTELLAFDVRDGRRVAALSLGEGQGRWVGFPLSAPDGRVVVARQKYLESEASLMVYRLARADPAGTPNPVDYNARVSPPGSRIE